MSAARMLPMHDPAEWADDFSRWASKHCAFRDGCFGGVDCLDKHFSDWCLAESVPCRLDVFKALLIAEGFDVRGDLVYGLILAGDYEYLEQRKRGAQ